MLISFCIISNGKKSHKTKLLIKSIHKNFTSQNDYEIIIVGNNIKQFDGDNIKIIEDDDFVEFLGKRKNIATEKSNGEIIVHCDDDILFPPTWFRDFKKYNKINKDWFVLGNRVLLPSGERYWDRNTIRPTHVMVDYNEESKQGDIFYQSGCFGIFKKQLLEEISWNNSLPYYADRKGFLYNEDVEFSIRLYNSGVDLHFDKNNTVWHYDLNYISNNLVVARCKERGPSSCCTSFISLLNKLST